jgi:octaprenyl-diphosphate synthase
VNENIVEEFFRDSFSTDNPVITDAVKRMLSAGGKRLRPHMTMLAAQACGGDAFDHVQLASYMELIHVATLIHDDVVDHAETRRGVNATAVDFGNRVSVLAGDYLFAWIFKNVTASYAAPIPHVLSATLADICDGEVLQLRAIGDLDLPLAAYIDIVDKKTATLFSAAARCGAIAAGGAPEATEALAAYGRAYGVAFQMKDDLLDLTADERTLGKPVGSDLRERKMTVPLILALRGGDRAFREMVGGYYTGTGDGAIRAVVDAIRDHGGIRETNAEISRYVRRAGQALDVLPESAAKRELETLAQDLGEKL